MPSGLILSVVSRNFSLRIGGLLGALFMATGSFLTVFISSTNQLPLTFGMLQGIGFGMMVPVCYSTLNHYFVRRRTTVMSLIKAIQGFVLIWYPQLIKIMILNYGFRATLLIISGISLHIFPGMITMKTNFGAKKRPANSTQIASREKQPEAIDLLHDTPKGIELQDNVITDKKSTNTFRNKFLEQFNLKVLNDSVFCNICLGQSFVNFSDMIFFVLQPMLLFQYGLDTNQVATCISVSAGADVAGRFGLVFISSIITINTRVLFYVATFFTLIARIAILQVRQFIWVTCMTSLLGILRAWLHVSSPLVISNHVSHQDFTGAYALFMLAAGVVNVVFSPLIGLIKDLHQDYIPAFYALTVCCLPCLVFWPVEYYILKRRNNETASENQSM
ncbi:unnamed protein product, partial [Brenthis ino]